MSPLNWGFTVLMIEGGEKEINYSMGRKEVSRG